MAVAFKPRPGLHLLRAPLFRAIVDFVRLLQISHRCRRLLFVPRPVLSPSSSWTTWNQNQYHFSPFGEVCVCVCEECVCRPKSILGHRNWLAKATKKPKENKKEMLKEKIIPRINVWKQIESLDRPNALINIFFSEFQIGFYSARASVLNFKRQEDRRIGCPPVIKRTKGQVDREADKRTSGQKDRLSSCDQMDKWTEADKCIVGRQKD